LTIDCQGTNLPRSNQSSMDISFHNILYEIKFKSERQGNPGEIIKAQKREVIVEKKFLQQLYLHREILIKF
jgi:hypothetical protein